MNRPKQILSAILLIWLGLAFVPWAPRFKPQFWEQQTHWAFADHWRYGVDIVLQYGPWGFWGVPMYHPVTFPILLFVHLLAFGISVYVIRALSVRLVGHKGQEWLHASAVFLPLCLNPVTYYSPLLHLPFLLALALVLLHFGCEDCWEVPCKYLLIGGLGFSMWIKANLGPALLVTILSIAVDEIWRLRRVPRSLLTFVTTFSAAWWLGHQKFNTLGAYWHYIREFIAGYRGAASLWSFSSTVFALVFATTLLTVGMVLYNACRSRMGGRAVIPVTIWYLMGYSVFLHGFVRADAEHTVYETLALLAATALVGPWILGQVRDGRLVRVTRVFVTMAFFFTAIVAIVNGVAPGRLLITGPRDLVNLIRRGPQGLREQYEAELAGLQREGAALDIRGPAEMAAGHPSNPGILLRTPGFRPRPTIISYAAVTPNLIELNRSYLESNTGPATILFQPDAIDDLYPTYADSASFLTLATHYRLREGFGLPLVFERRERASGVRLKVILSETVHFDQAIDLLPFAETPLWVSVSPHTKLIGSLLAIAFKPPPVSIEVVVDGKRIRKRLPVSQPPIGMLMSPYLEKTEDFRQFYAAPAAPVRFKRVVSLSVPRYADPPFSETMWLKDKVDILVQSVAFEQ